MKVTSNSFHDDFNLFCLKKLIFFIFEQDYTLAIFESAGKWTLKSMQEAASCFCTHAQYVLLYL